MIRILQLNLLLGIFEGIYDPCERVFHLVRPRVFCPELLSRTFFCGPSPRAWRGYVSHSLSTAETYVTAGKTRRMALPVIIKTYLARSSHSGG